MLPPLPLPLLPLQTHRRQHWRPALVPTAAAAAATPYDAEAEAAADAKLAAFEAALGGVSRTAVLHLLERAPPAVCSFSGETLELTLASLEAALGYDRAAVVQLVRLSPDVLLRPHEPGAVLRRLTALLRLPVSMVATSLRTRLHVLSMSEAQLTRRCAALGRILQCGGEPGGGCGAAPMAARSSSGSSGGSKDSDSGEDAAGFEGFAAFALNYPGQALALVAHPERSVQERLDAAAEALDGAPEAAVAALARARPLILELSDVVLRSRAAVLADAAFPPPAEGVDAGAGDSGDNDRAGSSNRSSSGATATTSGRDSGTNGSASVAAQQQQQQRRRLHDLLAALDPAELEGLADRLLLAPHSLHLWQQQMAALLPGRPPLDVVRVLLRVTVRPADVLVRWQALQQAVRGDDDGWGAQLAAAAPPELAALLSLGHEQLARLRYLEATSRRGEVKLAAACSATRQDFDAQFPGFMEWVRCGG